MPSGYVHRRLWRANFPNAALGAALLCQYHGLAAVGVLAGYALGNIVEPDLDILDRTRSENDAIKAFGVAAGYVWIAFWLVYALLIPHRSRLSHGLVVSTAIRLLYLFWWVPLVWDTGGLLWVFAFGVFLGLVISDSVHIIADKLLNNDGRLGRKLS